jgi:hypothetical protein
VELGYIYTLALTSAIDGVGDQRHKPSALPAGKTKVIQFTGCCVAPAPICRLAENRASPSFNPRTVQPAESRYTDCAIAGYQITVKAVKISTGKFDSFLEVKYPAGFTRLPNLEIHFIHLKLRFIQITDFVVLIHQRKYKNLST